ncbi:MAG TPA: hypothetical protein VF844_08495 [Ktedonobacteraceae bacterium]
MRKQFTGSVFTILALATILVSIFGASFVFAKGQNLSTAHKQSATSAKPATAPMLSIHTVDMKNVPAESASSAKLSAGTAPFLTGVSSAVYAQRKAAALHNQNAPLNLHPAQDSPYTPLTLVKFRGMADSPAICPPSGCQPPDQALATSPNWVLQGVNASFAVYNTTGTRQLGWPKKAKKFFGVPNPGICSSSGPFLSDPRAFYDPQDGRFWVAMLEVEGAFGVNSCAEKTIYWIAVSQTNNPSGVWNVYAFNMALGTTNAADYTQFGFDQTAIYFSGNMFNRNGTIYEYAESFSALKSSMEAGLGVTAFGFTNFSANGALVDTMQPVENEASSGPGAGLLINSFNINGDGTHNCFSTACSGVVVWAIANPGTASVSVTGVIASTSFTYINPPLADQPGCTACIETIDTRITGTPVYQAGSISFALETASNNGTQNVPGIFWGLVQPTISGGKITGASVNLNGTYAFSGDRAASFGALMQTKTGNLLMVFDTMSSTLAPSIMYATRLTTDLGGFEPAKFLKKSLVATTNSRWGDYEATSYDGIATNNVWFSSQFSGTTGDWATFIGKVNF